MQYRMWRGLFACLLLAVAVTARAEIAPQVSARVAERMRPLLDDGTISGAVTLVAQHGEIVSLDAHGYSDVAKRLIMRRDTLFWIASMTKPVTATAVLMLQDEGKLSVDDPVEKHLPEFKNQWLVQEKSGDKLALVRPARPVTIRDLLTHTSGLGEVSAPRPDCSLAELVIAYAQQPLQFQPGSKWSYSNPGINTLGRIVEVASGQPYQSFLQQRIFQPLGMKDTTFWPSPSQARRLAKAYQPGAGGLEETDIFFIKGPLSDRTRTAFPAGGLFSTAPDYWRFCQMMLNGGTWKGKRLLSTEAAQMMTRTQTGELKTGFTDGMSFGFGFAVVKQPADITALLSPGTFGHGGAYGTQAWVDPKRDLVMVLMIQRAKLPNADASVVRRAFQEAVLSGPES